jgi:hypothetical protein
MNVALKASLFAALVACSAWSQASTADPIPTVRTPIVVADDGINPQPLPPRSGHQSLPPIELASDTDIHHCSVQCTPEGGCEYVCYHMTY